MKEDLKLIIGKSIDSNYNKNIFIKKEEVLPLGSILYSFLRKNIERLKALEDLEGIIIEVSEYTRDNILKMIMITNQYVLITEDLEKAILKLTMELYNNIFKTSNSNDIKIYLSNYQKNIIKILEGIDELKSMDKGEEWIEIIPCSQYDPKYQISILNIDIENLQEPILDIGCGVMGELARTLRSLGLEAYGIDRKIQPDKVYLEELSWFDKRFEEGKWGTIISHLSFTNHFKREHLKLGDGHIKYAKKYMEILNSLKKGGSFYYVPDLEFIEQFISREKFKIEKYNLSKQAREIKSVKITRIK